MTRSRRGSTALSGVLVIDKPAGMTSHDVVAAVRRSTGEGRVGHAGTLDPAATGVLVVLLGPATRLAPYLSGADKEYRARIVFGTRTETDDAEGAPLCRAPVPEKLGDPSYAASVVSDLVGTHEQVPPAYSALKRAGVTAHRAARAGVPLDLKPRPIEILDARLHTIEQGDTVAWEVDLTVTKGAYVRAIARDLGEELGTAAHLGGLRRTRSGTLSLTESHSLDEAVSAACDVARLFADPLAALGLPVRAVAADEARRVGVGASLSAAPLTTLHAGDHVAVADDSFLWAVYTAEPDDVLRPVTVIAGGIPR